MCMYDRHIVVLGALVVGILALDRHGHGFPMGWRQVLEGMIYAILDHKLHAVSYLGAQSLLAMALLYCRFGHGSILQYANLG